MATQTDLNTISNALDNLYSIALENNKISNELFNIAKSNTQSFSAYNLLANSNFPLSGSIYNLVSNQIDLAIQNNYTVWPFQLTNSLSGYGVAAKAPSFSFTRNSSATRINAQGYLELVGNNVPRFDYDPISLSSKGLLIEQTSINYFTNGYTLSNWYSVPGTTTYNSELAPDNTFTATKFIPISGNSGRKDITIAANVPSGLYLLSVYIKPAGYYNVRVFFNDLSSGYYGWTVSFNLSTGTILGDTGTLASATIQSMPNGWFRCSMYNPISRFGITTPLICIGDPNGGDGLIADGTSGIYVWGAQLEQVITNRGDPTSLIITRGLTAQRNTDIAYLSGSSYDSFYNNLQSTFIIDYTTPYIRNGVSNPRILGYLNSVNNIYEIAANSNGSLRSFSSGYPYLGIGDTNNKYPSVNRVGYSLTNSGSLSGKVGSRNGSVTVSAAAIDQDIRNGITLGSNGFSNNDILNGHIRQLEYYNSAFSGSQLSTLTLLQTSTPTVDLATIELNNYVQRCGKNVTDTKNLYKFIKGCIDLGIWNNMVCWPMRLGQNAVTGNTVYSLGGLGVHNGTINGVIYKTLSGNLYDRNSLITTTFNIGYSAVTCGYFGTSPTTNNPPGNIFGGQGNMFAAADLTNTYSFYWLNPRSGFGNEFKFLDSYTTLPDNTLSGFNSWISVGQAGTQTKGYINGINTTTSSITAIPVSSIPNYTLGTNLIIGRNTDLYQGTLTLPFIMNTALPSLSVTALYNLYKLILGQGLNLP